MVSSDVVFFRIAKNVFLFMRMDTISLLLHDLDHFLPLLWRLPLVVGYFSTNLSGWGFVLPV